MKCSCCNSVKRVGVLECGECGSNHGLVLEHELGAVLTAFSVVIEEYETTRKKSPRWLTTVRRIEKRFNQILRDLSNKD